MPPAGERIGNTTGQHFVFTSGIGLVNLDDPFSTQSNVTANNMKGKVTITKELIKKIGGKFSLLHYMDNGIFAIMAKDIKDVLFSYVAIDYGSITEDDVLTMHYSPMTDMPVPKVLLDEVTENYKIINKTRSFNFHLRTDNIPKYMIAYFKDEAVGFSIQSDKMEIKKLDNASEQMEHIKDVYRLCAGQIHEQVRNHLRQYELNTRRTIVNSKKHQSKKIGLYIKHKIPFSCEIEAYGKSREDVAYFTNKMIGKEIGVCNDGSLTSNLGYPIEMQTPILSGKRGEILVSELCQKLREADFKIDHTCGLHIHLDGDCFGLRDDEIRTGNKVPTGLLTTYLFYRVFDPVIMSFLPSTRRNNRYCAELAGETEYHGTVISQDSTDRAFEIVKSMRSLLDFEMYWYKTQNPLSIDSIKSSRYTPTRYYGVNFHSLLKDNHIEIRYHSGTLNYEKILYWTSLHGNIVEKCCNGTITIEQLEEIKNTIKNKDKLRNKLYELVGLNEEEIAYFELRYNTFKGVKNSVEILINKTKKSETA